MNSITVADLHAKLAYLVERGRGGDEVTFGWTDGAEVAISDQTRAQLSSSDWSLRDVAWSDDDDYFTTLLFEPNHLDQVGALIEASSLGTPEATALRASTPDATAVAIVERSKEIGFEELIDEAWREAADGCLRNTGHRKQDPCQGCVTNQLLGRVEEIGEAATRLVRDHHSLVFGLFSQARGDGARFRELLHEHGLPVSDLPEWERDLLDREFRLREGAEERSDDTKSVVEFGTMEIISDEVG